MANNAVSIFEAMGTEAPAEPSWADKALGAVGLKDSVPVVHEGVVSIFAAQGMEEPEPTTLENIGGFLHDPESWKDMGGSVAKGPKVAMAAADMLLGIPGQALGVGADFGARLYALASGESRKTSETAGQLAMEEIPEALTIPLQNLAKKLFGAEPISQEAVTQTIDAGASIVDQYTKGALSAADAKSALNIVMLGAGVKGVEMGVKEAVRPRKEVPRAVEEVPPEEPAPAQPSLYERVAPEAKALTPEEAVAASKQRIKDMKAAVKAETPAEKAARLATTRLPETEATWTSGKDEIPVRITGEPVKGQDGKMYTPVKQQGTSMLVPTEELKVAPKVEPQVGLPAPKVAPVAAEPQGPGVTPKTKLVEGKTLAELREPPSSLDTAIAKVKEGRGFSLSAEEVLSLNRVTRAGGKIVGTDGKSIGPALKQSGAVDPRMLAALGITSGAVALTLQPEGIEKLSNLGLVGLGVTVMKRGEGTPLSALKESAHPYRWNTLEALPEGKIQFSKQEVLDRATKWPSEKKVLERVLGGIEGDKVSAKALMEGVLEESANWKLTSKETVKYADYGLNNIDRKVGTIYQTGEGVPAQEGAITTQWELPEHMQMSDANHFNNARQFGWTRSFPDEGIQHVVEIQSDLAQHAKGAVAEAERPALMKRVEEIDAKLKEARARSGDDAVRSAEYMRLKLEAREIANKLNATAIDSQLSPIIKNWPRQLIRHTLQDAAGKGEGKVRFASADTVAKVEGWGIKPEYNNGKYSGNGTNQFLSEPGHQSIYNRYAGEITRYLKGLGGVEVTDSFGHTWLEVPTKSVLDTKGRIEQVGAARTELLAGIAAAGGVTAYLVANPDDAGKLAVLGLLGTVAAKGKSLKGVLEADLVQRVRGGDAAAFAELYQRTSPTVKNSLRSYEKSGVDVEDVVQRTYEKVYKALEKDPEAPGGFRGDSSVETFAYRTAQNLAKNAVRDAKTKPQTVSLETEIGEGRTLEDTLGHGETPLKSMETQALQQKLSAAMEKVDPDFRRAFEMRELEGMSYEDIAAELGVPVGTVRSRIFRAKEQLQHSMRDYRGKESGEVNKDLVKAMAVVSGGVAVGAAYADDPQKGAIVGGILALGGLGLGTHPVQRAVMRGTTRLADVHPTLRRAARDMERAAAVEITAASNAISGFIKPTKKLSKEQYAALDKAYSEADPRGLAEAMKGNLELVAGHAKLRTFLQEVGDRLILEGRFKEGVPDYLPLMVKDYKGLMNSLGQTVREGLEGVLHKANLKSHKTVGRALNEVETAVVVNNFLLNEPSTSYLPGYAKHRRLKMTPETRPFYHTMEDALIHYAHAAVADLAATKFFAQDVRTIKVKGNRYTNIEGSIGAQTARLLDEKLITPEQAVEIQQVLRARFIGGEQSPAGWLQDVRNVTSASLLLQIGSGLIQTSEGLFSVYHHNLRPAVEAAGILVTGRGIKPAEFGLANHVIEEVVGSRFSGRMLSKGLKLNLLAQLDQLGMSQNLTASFIKNKLLVKTPRGQAQLIEKWGADYGADMPQLIKELQQSTRTQRTPLVESLLYQELSDVRPTSRMEATELLNAHPNIRLLGHLKQFMLTQADIVYRDGIKKIKTGEPRQVAIGLKNLALYSATLAFATVPAEAIKDWIMGRGLRLDKIDYVDNFVSNFGLSRYTMDKTSYSNAPGKTMVETARNFITPPTVSAAMIAAEGLSEPAKLVPFVPVVGRVIYNRSLGGNEKKEIYDTRLANKGLPKGKGKKLSAEAKMYLRKKQLAKKVEELHK